jgi:hypothetical protein
MRPASDHKYSWPGASNRVRLHSLSMLVLARVFALLLAASTVGVVQEQAAAVSRVGALRAIGEGALHVLLIALVVGLLWFRRRVIATRAGLEVAIGRKQRLIPWSRVIDVRELPWLRQNPPWHPKLWQVDLRGGESFDFIGIRRAREIVASFILD